MSRRGHRSPLLVSSILAWADAYHARTGRWPTVKSGRIHEADEETWGTIGDALRRGGRGLPGATSLPDFLAQERGVHNPRAVPPITIPEILQWADAYHKRHGIWPIINSGAIPEAPGETWLRVESALRTGGRSLPGGMSLKRLLQTERRARYPRKAPFFTIERILAWADGHYARTGKWPTRKSGPIHELPGVEWATVQGALSIGYRGLPGGSTLAKVLAEHRAARNRDYVDRLDIPLILDWARAFHSRTGQWPKAASGPVHEAPGETWHKVDNALRTGRRGLAGGLSLAVLIRRRCRPRLKYRRENLSVAQILAWVDAYHDRHGSLPTRFSGRIPETRTGTWKSVCRALSAGRRGLPGGMTLARLLQVERRSLRRGAAAMRMASLPSGSSDHNGNLSATRHGSHDSQR